MTGYRPAVAVHVVWHPRCAVGAALGEALFGWLFEDPDELAGGGLRIPVRLWRGDPAGGPPPLPPYEESGLAALVVLLGDELVADPAWPSWLDQAVTAARPDDLLLGVSLTSAALELNSPLLDLNLIRLHDVNPNRRQALLRNRVTHALCRRLAGTDRPVRVFLSHAKQDGVAITTRVRDYLSAGSGLGNFFDAQDLPEGSRWADLLRREAAAAAEVVLLTVRTDGYAGRDWCRSEVLEAKRAGSPIVVLDALAGLEPRGFRYLGNTPAVRWSTGRPAELDALLGVLLQETLRFRHFPRRVADLCQAYRLPDDPRVLPAPPELLTVLRARDQAPPGGRQLVYPDPPLGTDELALLAELAPDLEPVTPTGLISRGSGR